MLWPWGREGGRGAGRRDMHAQEGEGGGEPRQRTCPPPTLTSMSMSVLSDSEMRARPLTALPAGRGGQAGRQAGRQPGRRGRSEQAAATGRPHVCTPRNMRACMHPATGYTRQHMHTHTHTHTHAGAALLVLAVAEAPVVMVALLLTLLLAEVLDGAQDTVRFSSPRIDAAHARSRCVRGISTHLGDPAMAGAWALLPWEATGATSGERKEERLGTAPLTGARERGWLQAVDREERRFIMLSAASFCRWSAEVNRPAVV